MADARSCLGLEFCDGPRLLVLGERFAVPSFLVLNEGDSSALESFSQDHQRLGAEADRCEHLGDLVHVMAVNLLGAPAEGLEPVLVSGQIVPERRRLALAQAVDAHDGHQVV